MRSDEKARLQEQRLHLLQELRSISEASKAAGLHDLSPADAARFDEVERQIKTINGELEAEHQSELQEIRSAQAGGSGRFMVEQGTKARAFAREPLYEAFRAAGFARGKPAEIALEEFRSITWTGSVDNVNQPRRAADLLGYDQRYA